MYFLGSSWSGMGDAPPTSSLEHTEPAAPPPSISLSMSASDSSSALSLSLSLSLSFSLSLSLSGCGPLSCAPPHSQPIHPRPLVALAWSCFPVKVATSGIRPKASSDTSNGIAILAGYTRPCRRMYRAGSERITKGLSLNMSKSRSELSNNVSASCAESSLPLLGLHKASCTTGDSGDACVSNCHNSPLSSVWCLIGCSGKRLGDLGVRVPLESHSPALSQGFAPTWNKASPLTPRSPLACSRRRPAPGSLLAGEEVGVSADARRRTGEDGAVDADGTVVAIVDGFASELACDDSAAAPPGGCALSEGLQARALLSAAALGARPFASSPSKDSSGIATSPRTGESRAAESARTGGYDDERGEELGDKERLGVG
mmetsp:Transcript_29934/g.69221  ORF Transcript_29934/g.69221 Transcript_29934/m.69221 type:complete len:373 (-) Transcript_29934:1647-2765(-)